MPYTNPDGTAVYINDAGIASGGFVIDDLSKTGHEAAYAQNLTLLGNGVTFSNCTVSSGGVLSLGSGATLSGTTMYAGGSMQLNVSGGAMPTVKDFEFSGGVISGYSKFILSSGTIYSGTTLWASTYWLSNGKGTYAGGGVLSNVTIKSGAVLKTATGMSFCNITAEKGASVAFGGAVNFIGRSNNITKGTLVGHTNAYTTDGVMYGYNATGATHFTNIVVSGLNMSSTVYGHTSAVFSGVTIKTNSFLMLSAGASAYNFYDYYDSGAQLRLHYGTNATNAVTIGGSTTSIRQGNIGYLDATYNKYVSDPNIFIRDGVISSMTLQYKGNTSTTYWLTRVKLASGISAQSPVISSGGTLYVSRGAVVLDPQTFSSAAIYVYDGGLVSGGVLSGNGNTSGYNREMFVYSGGEARGFTLSGALVYVSKGATVKDATVASGNLWLFDAYAEFVSPGRPTLSGSGITVLAKGSTLVRGVNARATDIVVSGGKLFTQNAANVDGVTVLSGGTATVSASTDSTTIDSGAAAYLRNVDVVNGNVSVGFNGNLDGIDLHEGTVYVFSGGVLRDLTQSGGAVYVRKGGVIIGAAVSGGAVNFFDANTEIVSANRPVLSGADLTVRANGAVAFRGVNARGSNIEVAGADACVYVQNGAQVEDITILSGGSGAVYTNTGSGVVDSGATVTARNINVVDGVVSVGIGGTVDGIDLQAGAISCYNASGAVVNARISGGVVDLLGTLSNATVTGGEVLISNGATGNEVTIGENGAATVAGTLNVATSAWNVAVANGGVVNVGAEELLGNANAAAGARINFTCNKTGANFTGADTNIAEGALWYSFAGSGSEGVLDPTRISGHIEGGVIKDLNADGAAIRYKLSIGDGIVVDGGILNQKFARISCFDGASVNGTVVSAGAIICNGGASGSFDDVTLAGGQMNLSGTARANRTVIENGGKLNVNAATASFDDTILKAGGQINFSNTALSGGSVDTGKSLTIDYAGATVSSASINWLDRLAGSTTVYMTGIDEAGNYEIKTSGGTLAKVFCGMYEVTSGAAAYTNGILGLTCSFNGTTLTAADAGIVTAATATKLTTSGTNINSGDLAVKWDATTDYSANAFLADGLTTGNAWLNIDGFARNTANVYGAAKDQDFAGIVNIGALAGTVKNLAAGAALGGKVAGVKLTVEDGMTVTGAVYAGGMGDVTGDTETLIEGGTFAGNVFAGALCNYAANATATATDDINLTINGGTFGNNIYAGAAVKAGAATGVVHTAEDIMVELNGGAAVKGTFCVYGGGYATGTVEDALVYTAGDVAITVTGGAWGAYLSGRGIFGGAYADKVAASVDSVDITVTGGTMGNVYGGGWAQNGGTSTVTGEVNITIAGDAQIANVFGGGSYSTNGNQGATSVGSVNITISGGNIKNNIFAGGQGESSTVAGDVSVIFTGSSDYVCNVYGYVIPASATDTTDKTLAFADYTGILSGDIGGFDGITFSGDTAATLSGTNIDNGDWAFDYTDRTLDAGLAMLTLNGGSFAGDESSVAVDLSDVEQVASGWSIAAGLTSADVSYGVELSTGSASGLRLNDTLDSSYGIYEGWGFTLEDSTLKFKQLA